jgi:5'-nucleotidase
MRVGIDLDGIVVDLPTAWYRECNAQFGDDLTVEKVRDWDPVPYAKCGDKVFEVLKRPGFYAGLDPLPGAVEGVARLVDEGHQVVIVSAVPKRAPAAWGDKAAWVQHHLPMVDPNNVVLTHNKSLVKLDVLFDDGPHNLLDYYEAWPAAYLATIAYPYNEEVIARLRPENPRFLPAGHYTDTAAAWHAFTLWVDGLGVAVFQARHARWFAATGGR